jgi:L,D-peptidoglycan transpeptidase YkuD (ErfK/YbiS/YcfS/YnhG family)
LRELLVATSAALVTATVVAGGPPVVDRSTTQVVMVTVADWRATTGRLSAFERDPGGTWRPAGITAPVVIGRTGCGWGRGLHLNPDGGPRKREGDGRSPAGVFLIGPAFGATDRIDTGLDYRCMSHHDWCIDLPDSPHYNRIVDDRVVGPAAVAGSTEPMRRDLHLDGDRAYTLGFVVGHNCDCLSGAGSCIFAHLWEDEHTPTAGCTAMAEADLRSLLAWLEADARPVFVLLPMAESTRVATGWGLPVVKGDGSP